MRSAGYSSSKPKGLGPPRFPTHRSCTVADVNKPERDRARRECAEFSFLFSRLRPSVLCYRCAMTRRKPRRLDSSVAPPTSRQRNDRWHFSGSTATSRAPRVRRTHMSKTIRRPFRPSFPRLEIRSRSAARSRYAGENRAVSSEGERGRFRRARASPSNIVPRRVLVHKHETGNTVSRRRNPVFQVIERVEKPAGQAGKRAGRQADRQAGSHRGSSLCVQSRKNRGESGCHGYVHLLAPPSFGVLLSSLSSFTTPILLNRSTGRLRGVLRRTSSAVSRFRAQAPPTWNFGRLPRGLFMRIFQPPFLFSPRD